MIRPDLEREDGSATGRRVWVLNFDAEDELARGRGHNATAGARARMETLVAQVASLVGDDQVLPVTSGARDPRVPEGTVGHAWCPTASALRRLAACGAEVPGAPSLEVLRLANHRRFSADLGATLPAAGFFTDETALLAHLSAGSPTGSWVLKRPFSFAGRGRLRVGDGARDVADAAAWIGASFAGSSGSDGLDVSPWVERLGDYALHGFLSRDRHRPLRLSAPTAQMCDPEGRWLRSSRATDLTTDEERALRDEGARTGERLAAIGYFGPFGIDAFRYADPATGRPLQPRFCPRIEVNARYTMAWACAW